MGDACASDDEEAMSADEDTSVECDLPEMEYDMVDVRLRVLCNPRSSRHELVAAEQWLDNYLLFLVLYRERYEQSEPNPGMWCP